MFESHALISFYLTFQVNPEKTEHQLIYDLGNRQWDIPRLRQLLEDILPRNTSFEDFEVEYDFESVGRKTMLSTSHDLRSPLISVVGFS